MVFVTQTAFYPDSFAGDSVRAHSIIRGLRKRGVWVAVLHMHDPDQDFVDYDSMRKRCDYLKVVYPSERDLLRRMSSEIDDWCSPSLVSALSCVVSKIRPTAVLAQFLYSSKCLLSLSNDKDILKILDADNVFSFRRETFVSRNIPYTWFSTYPCQERLGLRRADVVLAIQENELSKLRALSSTSRFVMQPTTRKVEFLPDVGASKILFVGADNAENRIGIEGFIDFAMPKIWARRPEVELRIAGGVSRHVNKSSHVKPLGVVDDLTVEYRRASIAINSTWAGTGLKTKSVDALCNGRCLVTTPAGADGLGGNADAFVIVDSYQSFAEKILDLLADPSKRRNISLTGFNIAKRLFCNDHGAFGLFRVIHNWEQMRSTQLSRDARIDLCIRAHKGSRIR